jgi:hypothetical protein
MFISGASLPLFIFDRLISRRRDMNNKKVWMHTPDAGGVKIPPPVRSRITERITRYAEAQYGGRYSRLDIRCRGVFCYIDAYLEPSEPSPELLNITGETREAFMDRLRNTPVHLCRLRYFGDEEAWGLAFYTYSNERYELCMYRSGGFFGPVEEAFDIGAMYLSAE